MHVVGRPGHDVADPLAAVLSLAFAEQADVECVASVSLDPLGHELVSIVAKKAGQALADSGAHHSQRCPDQGCVRPPRMGDQVEGTPVPLRLSERRRIDGVGRRAWPQ